jgi:predicted transcriptional regulator of viral defense system
MNRLQAIETLKVFDKKGRFVFSKHDMAKLFPNDTWKTLKEGLNRLVKAGLLTRACRGVYVNNYSLMEDSYIIEHVAKVLRRGEYNYVSLESILSEYGVISQIPIDRLTVMTTGREGVYKTPYGVLEFTHTKRSVNNILNSIQRIPGRPLRVATKETAIRDLKRVGRNISLLYQGNDDDE